MPLMNDEFLTQRRSNARMGVLLLLCYALFNFVFFFFVVFNYTAMSLTRKVQVFSSVFISSNTKTTSYYPSVRPFPPSPLGMIQPFTLVVAQPWVTNTGSPCHTARPRRMARSPEGYHNIIQEHFSFQFFYVRVLKSRKGTFCNRAAVKNKVDRKTAPHVRSFSVWAPRLIVSGSSAGTHDAVQVVPTSSTTAPTSY